MLYLRYNAKERLEYQEHLRIGWKRPGSFRCESYEINNDIAESGKRGENRTRPKDAGYIEQRPKNDFQEGMELPDSVDGFSVKAIEGRTFLGNKEIRRISIPETVRTIGESTFAGCKSLTKIDLPEGLACIGCDAFSDCGLSEMTLPRSIRYIEEMIFCMGPTPRMMYLGSRDDWVEKVDVDDDAFAGGVKFLG